ncbi:MAG: iron chelate uptake ABC transporter family permease subunit [Pseudorhodoplanes sp.]|nr:iron chelate uptake ABC transporter family permease subunit [Pseudorhodoplanes sp.]
MTAIPVRRTRGSASRALPRPGAALALGVLAILLLAVAVVSSTVGPAGIPLQRLAAALGLTQGGADLVRDQLVLWSVRLPRIVLAAMVGAMLAVAGAVMQGLFRNPLADPALIGVSSGAAFAAASTIVMTDRLVPLAALLPVDLLPVAAFLGALIATVALYRIATHSGRTSIAILLLGGLAIAAMTNAGLGLLVYLANDQQLRDINFWLLGSLGGATWHRVATIAPFLLVTLGLLPLIARGLDLLSLGESEAFHAGIAVERLKRIVIVLIAAAIGAAVSVSGVIGFVGIVIPHLLRIVIGPGHRLLLPASALLGAALLLAADTVARTIAAPAELPIGIVTAAIGAPFFLGLLLRQRTLVGL